MNANAGMGMNDIKQLMITKLMLGGGGNHHSGNEDLYKIIGTMIALTFLNYIFGVLPILGKMISDRFHKKMETITQDILPPALKPIKSRIKFSRNYKINEGYELIDALIEYLSNIDSVITLYRQRFYVMGSKKNESFKVNEDITCILKMANSTDEGYDRIDFELYSETLVLSELRKWVDNTYKAFEYNKQNKFGDDRFFFNETAQSNMGGPTKNLMFSMTKFNTNKSLNTLYGPSIKILKNRVDLFKNNVSWYKKNGIPHTLGILLHGPPGSGKCTAKDTPILLNDGTIKMVQNIKVGEMLMGDDSTPREVLSLATGKDDMYDIIPTKGDKFTVNKEHILCLKMSGYPRFKFSKNENRYRVCYLENNEFKTKSFVYQNEKENKNEKEKHAKDFFESIKTEQILEIAVKDYLKLSKNKKDKLKLYRVAVNFVEKELPIDPYIIGYWLGDGTSLLSQITTEDEEVVEHFKNFCIKHKHRLHQGKRSETTRHDFHYTIYGSKRGDTSSNIFLNVLKKYNLLDNKHIPHDFKCNSRENRLQLLAGLIDSDGHLDKNGGFEFTQKDEILMDDVIYLARSLGFSCYKSMKDTTWTHNGIKKKGKAYRICINGEGIDQIPTKIKRKQSKSRGQIKDVLVTGFEVKYMGIDNYYGFELDGNGRYLIGDFTVTHNTSVIKGIAKDLNRHIFNLKFTKNTTQTQLWNLFYNDSIYCINDNSSAPNRNYIPTDQRVYVLEDVDCLTSVLLDRRIKEQEEKKQIAIASKSKNAMSVNHEAKKKMEEMQNEGDNAKLNLSFLLGLIDGLLETPGRILIISSNYPERLDKAILRPGRIDINMRLGECDVNTIKEMFTNFYDERTKEDFSSFDFSMANELFTPAYIQKILSDFFDDPKEGYKQLLEEVIILKQQGEEEKRRKMEEDLKEDEDKKRLYDNMGTGEEKENPESDSKEVLDDVKEDKKLCDVTAIKKMFVTFCRQTPALEKILLRKPFAIMNNKFTKDFLKEVLMSAVDEEMAYDMLISKANNLERLSFEKKTTMIDLLNDPIEEIELEDNLEVIDLGIKDNMIDSYFNPKKSNEIIKSSNFFEDVEKFISNDADTKLNEMKRLSGGKSMHYDMLPLVDTPPKMFIPTEEPLR